MLGALTKLLKAIQSEAGPWQLAWGFSLGMMLGLTPFWLLSFVVLLLLMILRVNVAAAMAGWAIFAVLSLLTNPLAHALGEWLLLHPALQDGWTALYQFRLWQLMRFHHTLTLGSWLIALVLLVPMAIAAHAAVPPIRQHVIPRLQKYHLIRTGKSVGLIGRMTSLWRS